MTANSEDWVQVATLADFAGTDRKLIRLGPGWPVGLFKRPDGFYAIDAMCTHEQFSLLEGEVTDHEVECPGHASRFDLRKGRSLCLPAVRPVRCYAIKVEVDRIYLRQPAGDEVRP